MGKKNRLLVTTPLEVTWGSNEEIVFLGEWCKLYGNEQQWKNRNSSVVEYHWTDRNKAFNDFQYIIKLYTFLINELTSDYNKRYKINYSSKEYSIIFGHWLIQFIVVVFDRWNSINYALKEFNNLETIALDFNKDNFIPSDTAEATDFFIRDSWNHVLISEIIDFYPEITKNNITTKIDIKKAKYHYKNADIKQKIIKKCIFYIFYLLSKFKRNKKTILYFITRPFSVMKLIKLIFNLDCNIISNYSYFKSSDNKFSDSINILNNFKSSNNFEAITVKLINDFIPKRIIFLLTQKDIKVIKDSMKSTKV